MSDTVLSFFWLHWVFVAVHELSLIVVWAPELMGSVVLMCGLSCRKEYGVLVPRPGLEPVSPGSEGGFLTTGPPGKPLDTVLNALHLLTH